MVDVHCHLDLYPNPIEIANESEKLGIYTIGVTNLPSHFAQGINHLRNYKKVRLALGMHPLYANRHSQEFELFRRYIDQTSYVGEIGLDFSKEGIQTKERQLESLEFVLKQLQNKKKLISLHSRSAEHEVFGQLLNFNIKTAIFHWYSGPIELIDEIVKSGYMFSVNPAMIKSKKGQQIISKIPISSLLTESDGPFIEINGRPVRPSDLGTVESYISKYLDKPIGFVQQQIKMNFQKLIRSIAL